MKEIEVLREITEIVKETYPRKLEEYKKIETIQIDNDKNTITLTLKPKKGQELNRQDIENCVDFAIDKAMKNK